MLIKRCEYLLAVLVLLQGCAPSATTLETADFGQPISRSHAEQQAEVWFEDNLIDPESRRVEWIRLDKVWVWQGLFGGGHKYGYGLYGTVNAKNRMGGYTGRKSALFVFRDAVLLGGTTNPPSDMWGFVEE